ncbi:MAG: zf-HC2 domain-containing protein [Armatimonadetes bacterium]|nr:zf-HC2 domain-containing protein [Armatimonadota bacterium]
MSDAQASLPAECASARAGLSEWLDGELSARPRAALERHLPGCPACRKEAAALQVVTHTVRRMPRPEPGETVRWRLLGQVWAEAGSTWAQVQISESGSECVRVEWGPGDAPSPQPTRGSAPTAPGLRVVTSVWQGWGGDAMRCDEWTALTG